VDKPTKKVLVYELMMG